MTVFGQVFAVVIGEEGGFDLTQSDPGNWTGGAVGSGILKGTNWGISASAYPSVDIRNLTQAQAQAIYHSDYWAPIGGDSLPPQTAMMAFDAAVNNGVKRAKVWLQSALGVEADGVIGPQTKAALAAAVAAPGGDTTLATEFLAWRIDFMGGLNTWQTFGLGWSRRLAALPGKAAAIAAA